MKPATGLSEDFILTNFYSILKPTCKWFL